MPIAKPKNEDIFRKSKGACFQAALFFELPVMMTIFRGIQADLSYTPQISPT
jgi:hypothetical protein